ncbi:formylglycine-generating enzyme family protein [Granulicella sibirica]|uniref:Sulfatase modifying factor 1 (C-alpha-formyglycine-generating enzyme 1) n=1 Tax=Granulicella sibirica TaxID=2479048 RepID=A0A4Q0T849_9BACT|nr:formylglycine-generating enzyme family protein [Granulicella sibirica]RXH57886.1 Sulfatase modifying factor 1 precursor (C-alpha-formyglycine- generating enzyme 1) [Granulicella sibirica]
MSIEVPATGPVKSACCSPAAHRDSASEPVRLHPSESKPDTARTSVYLPAATFLMGTDYKDAFSADGEGPIRPVKLDAYEIDTYPVTNRDFAAFIRDTGYKTEAERFGWSFVFYAHIDPQRFDELVQDTVAAAPWWCMVPGATWDKPEGPGSNVDARANYPVVHVSWNDAAAYVAWAGRSLPTEAQWEYAARGGLEQKLYPWGDELTPDGMHLCNIWQGSFPREDLGEDGYAGSSPVDAFPPNGHGLYSITGNVWEWCSDWFTPARAKLSPTGEALHHPTGPADGQARVMKGGSFLCHASYCNRYRVAARTSNTPDSSASNVGFRCARKL